MTARRFPLHVAHALYFLGTHKSITLLDGIQDYHLSHHVAAGKRVTRGFVPYYNQVQCFPLMLFRGAKPPAENVATPSVDPTLCHFMLFPVMLHLQTR